MKLALSVGMYMSLSLFETALRPPPSATVMAVKKTPIPIGAKMNWSKATRFIAGPKALVLLMGKIRSRNLNHLNWMGAMQKPYAMKRVRRSKSNGGGRLPLSGMRSRSKNGFFLSSS